MENIKLESKEYNAYLHEISNIKILNDIDKKKAKITLSKLNEIILKSRYEFKDSPNYLLTKYVRGGLKEKIRSYEKLTNTDFTIKAFKKYVSDSHLNEMEIKELSNHLFTL